MSKRKTCTKENPMPPKDMGRWEHPDAEEIGEQENRWPGGDIVTYKCPNCGQKWKEELPQ